MSNLPAPGIVDDVAAAVLRRRPNLDPRIGRNESVRIQTPNGSRQVRVFSRDPQTDVSFEVEIWGRGLVAQASFSNMPADVIAAAIVSALELGF